MDSKPNVVFEEFEVPTEWVHEVADDTLIAYLPEFKKEQLKVQITSGGLLRIHGERSLGGNKISRFSKEFPLPSNCDLSKIRANFNGGMLRVKFPKSTIQADQNQQAKTSPDPNPEAPPSMAAPPPADYADASFKQNDAVQQAPPTADLKPRAGDDDIDTSMKRKDAVEQQVPPRTGIETAAKGVTRSRKIVLAVLSVVVLAVYVKNVYRSMKDEYN
ncbi:protein RESTRICTED TEV MOVEMENT 2 isoform X2 [Gossypium australe]|uniref:Protein RESTRICTED TEV MOVEMENT 2 isoform X2 n=1 Tax=Gossypium australe TaxID=47621 RepID=A0A5B6VRG3_9ROSI|nr:protein RESTRICTED TEV MOVEMENT 2 isoform X2 [Gossypium australe]